MILLFPLRQKVKMVYSTRNLLFAAKVASLPWQRTVTAADVKYDRHISHWRVEGGWAEVHQVSNFQSAFMLLSPDLFASMTALWRQATLNKERVRDASRVWYINAAACYYESIFSLFHRWFHRREASFRRLLHLELLICRFKRQGLCNDYYRLSDYIDYDRSVICGPEVTSRAPVLQLIQLLNSQFQFSP